MATFFYRYFAGCTRTLGNRLAVNRRYRPCRIRRQFHDKLLRSRKTVVFRTQNITDTGSFPSYGTEKARSLPLYNLEQLIYIRAATVKARHKLASRRFIKFRRKCKRRPKTPHSRLADIIRRNVSPRFRQATTFAIFDSLSRRKHFDNVLSGHDGKVLLGRELLHGNFAQHIRHVLAGRKRSHFSCTRISHCLKNRNMYRKQVVREHQQKHQ